MHSGGNNVLNGSSCDELDCESTIRIPDTVHVPSRPSRPIQAMPQVDSYTPFFELPLMGLP